MNCFLFWVYPIRRFSATMNISLRWQKVKVSYYFRTHNPDGVWVLNESFQLVWLFLLCHKNIWIVSSVKQDLNQETCLLFLPVGPFCSTSADLWWLFFSSKWLKRCWEKKENFLQHHSVLVTPLGLTELSLFGSHSRIQPGSCLLVIHSHWLCRCFSGDISFTHSSRSAVQISDCRSAYSVCLCCSINISADGFSHLWCISPAAPRCCSAPAKLHCYYV